MTDAKRCISCGMPLIEPEDFSLGDMKKDWCLHCGNADGTLKPYDEVLVGMTWFMTQSQGIDEGAAREAAAAMMALMPAWQDR
jgi:hypothetical protein